MSTRKQILLHLKKAGPQTVEQLSHELEISPMGVRQHLSVLEKDNYVTHDQVRHQIGRPSYLFALTENAEDVFPKSYDVFAGELLSAIEENEGRGKVLELLELRAAKQYESRRRSMGQPTLSGRLKALAKILDDEGYLPEIESRSGELKLIVHNCAIIKIAQCYPQTCEREVSEYRRLLKADVTAESCQGRGDIECRFSVEGVSNEDKGLHSIS